MNVVWKRRGPLVPHAWIDGVGACGAEAETPALWAYPWRELSADELTPAGMPRGRTCARCANRVARARLDDEPAKLRGFAAMKAAGRLDELRAIARKGGSAAHQAGTAHKWSTDEARVAGRKGGLTGAGARGKSTKSAVRREQLPLGDDRPLWRRALETRRAAS